MAPRQAKFQERRGGCGMLGKARLTQHGHRNKSHLAYLLNGWLPVSPIPSASWAPLVNGIQTQLPWSLLPCIGAAGSLAYRCLSTCSLLRPLCSTETNFLSSVRTAQRPLTPSICKYPIRGETSDTLSKMIFNATSQKSSSESHSHPQVPIDADNFICGFSLSRSLKVYDM